MANRVNITQKIDGYNSFLALKDNDITRLDKVLDKCNLKQLVIISKDLQDRTWRNIDK